MAMNDGLPLDGNAAKPVRPRIPGLLKAFCIYSLLMMVVLPVPQFFLVAEMPSWVDRISSWDFRFSLLLLLALQHLSRIVTVVSLLSRSEVAFRMLRVYFIASTVVAVVAGGLLMDPCSTVDAGEPFLSQVRALLDEGQVIAILVYPAPLCAWWILLAHSRRVRHFRDAIDARAQSLPVDRPGEREESQREK